MSVVASHPFDDAIAYVVDGQRAVFEITEPWFQGRGAYGGLIAAQAAIAMTQALHDAERPLRSLTVHFAAPARLGALVWSPTLERSGASVATLTARATQSDGVVATASASFAKARAGRLSHHDVVLPDMPAPESLSPMSPSPVLPKFVNYFEFRFGGKTMPFSRASESALAAWVRPRTPRALDVPLLICLADALPPAAFARVDAPAPSSSVDLTVQLVSPLRDLSPDDPVLITKHSRVADQGCAEEQVSVYSRGGRLLATSRQFMFLGV